MSKKTSSFLFGALLIVAVHMLLLLHWPLYCYGEKALRTTYDGMPKFILKTIWPYVFSLIVFLAFYFTANQKIQFFLGRRGGTLIAFVMAACVLLAVFQVLYYVARVSIPPSVVPYMEENGWMVCVVFVFDVILSIIAIGQRHSGAK